MAISCFLTFAFAPAIGKMSDCYGRKPFLLVAVLASHAQYVVLAFDGNLWVYFAIAAISGVVAVSIALISSFIGDVCPPTERSRAFGQVVGVLGIGGLLGIGLGGTLHYSICKWLPLLFAFVNCIYIVFCVPESLHNPTYQFVLTAPLEGIGYLRKTHLIETVALMTFLATVAQNGIQDTILFYLRDQQGFTTQMLATFLIVGMGATVLVQWVGLPFMEDHMNHRTILIFGLSSCSVLSVSMAPLKLLGNFILLLF
jgi:DHA1 family tetracycline resistance protein-like MFS transporter